MESIVQLRVNKTVGDDFVQTEVNQLTAQSVFVANTLVQPRHAIRGRRHFRGEVVVAINPSDFLDQILFN